MEQFRCSNLLESQHSWFGLQLVNLQHCASAKKSSMRILMLTSVFNSLNRLYIMLHTTQCPALINVNSVRWILCCTCNNDNWWGQCTRYVSVIWICHCCCLWFSSWFEPSMNQNRPFLACTDGPVQSSPSMQNWTQSPVLGSSNSVKNLTELDFDISTCTGVIVCSTIRF